MFTAVTSDSQLLESEKRETDAMESDMTAIARNLVLTTATGGPDKRRNRESRKRGRCPVGLTNERRADGRGGGRTRSDGTRLTTQAPSTKLVHANYFETTLNWPSPSVFAEKVRRAAYKQRLLAHRVVQLLHELRPLP